MKRWLVRVVVLGVVALLVAQFLPLGRVDNPEVTQDAPWPSQEARKLAVSACYDCHSNEVQLEWFDRIAPASWLVQQHVVDGRAELNFSEWDREQQSDDDLAVSVVEGEMPLRSYTFAHPTARLSAEEKATLIAALTTLEEGGDDGSRRGRGGQDDDEG